VRKAASVGRRRHRKGETGACRANPRVLCQDRARTHVATRKTRRGPPRQAHGHYLNGCLMICNINVCVMICATAPRGVSPVRTYVLACYCE